MGIGSWLWGTRRVTGGWVRDPSLRLALDVDRGALCGVGMGEPIDRVSFLGPTDGREHPGHDLEYPSLGLSVGYTEGRIDFYGLWWRDQQGKGFQPYGGAVRLDGKPLAFGPTTREREIVAALGEPYWRDQDDLETILFYEVKDAWGGLTERQVELDGDGVLEALTVLAVPMLADEQQRRAVGVTRPWPPG